MDRRYTQQMLLLIKASGVCNTTNNTANSNAPTDTSFMDIPDSIDEELPFN